MDDISNKPAEEVWLDKKKAFYLQTGGTNCPICGESDGIEGGSVEIDAGGANQHCTCNNCNSDWYDMYTLTDVNIESHPADPMLEDLYPDGEKSDPNKAFKKEK